MLRFWRFAQQRPYNLRVPKESPMFTLNNNQRQAIIDEIRELFVHFNDGWPAPDFIENLWQNMTPDKLYMALGNFTRMAENEE
jgi:hypothetical protein